jgi:hypothetical protein
MSNFDLEHLGVPSASLFVTSGTIRWWEGRGIVDVCAHEGGAHWQCTITEMTGGNLELRPNAHIGYLGFTWTEQPGVLDAIQEPRKRGGTLAVLRTEFADVQWIWNLIRGGMVRAGASHTTWMGE